MLGQAGQAYVNQSISRAAGGGGGRPAARAIIDQKRVCAPTGALYPTILYALGARRERERLGHGVMFQQPRIRRP